MRGGRRWAVPKVVPPRVLKDMITLSAILLIIAFICFVLAVFSVAVPRVNLIAAGLALWVLAVLIGGGSIRLA